MNSLLSGSTFLKWVILLIGWPFLATAQLQVSYPMARLVVQRGANGTGRIYVSGRLTGLVDRVEAQLTPVANGQGTATDWQPLQNSPATGLFLGYVTGNGGWYVLTVRTVVGGNPAEQVITQPVGIGEVFITAGQSNARGLGIGDNDLGTATDRVNAIDSINHYYPMRDGAQLVSSGDPMPVPAYKALTATRRVFPMAESSWGWGELGDYIVNRYNVPVAFYVAGWDGSTVENWINSANGIPTCNRYNCTENWPNLQPYTNLKNVLNYYASMAGVRAVLWHQGEAEYDFGGGNTSIPYYKDRLTQLIQKSRQDFGGRNLPWVIARASFDGSMTQAGVIAAQQQQVIATAGLNAFEGPYNDTIINRNAGNSDVHFRNISRPSPHPRYYLNPAAIPAEMGLSRFARNWNNSLNDAFFQNAQPQTPAQFAVTGTLANYVMAGSTINVSFATLGPFGGDNQWQVQLLDAQGRYLAVLGSGATSPIPVTLPNAYQSGQFMVRVIASSPGLPAVPSNLFRISSQLAPADLSISIASSQRTPDLNTPVSVKLQIRNDGPGPATNVVVRDRLPDNLAIVSAGNFTQNGSILTGTLPTIETGATATLNFTVRPTAAGTYQNAVEIASSTTTDPDSQPNSGTGDGQDDEAQLDFRTRQSGSATFTSPNPNQVPLPAVVSNQPAPDPNKADVSVSLAVSNRAPAVNDIISYSITLSNAGGLAATGLSVAATLPTGQTFVSGNDLAPAGSRLVGGVSSLNANGSVTLIFRARATATGPGVCAVQLIASNQLDPDSTPNNGTQNGEDDATQVDVRVH